MFFLDHSLTDLLRVGDKSFQSQVILLEGDKNIWSLLNFFLEFSFTFAKITRFPQLN